MQTIHQLISEYQEDEKQKLKISVDYRSIKFQLSDCFEIKYEKSDGSTIVQCEKVNVDTKVEGNMIQVFYKDFKPFLVNRKAVLTSLKTFNFLSETETFTQIFELMELALKAKTDKLQVKNIRFHKFNTETLIALLKFMDPECLTTINLYSPNIDEICNFLLDWNKGCRLDMTLRFENFSREDLDSVKKVLSYSSIFDQVQVTFSKLVGVNKETLNFAFKPFNLTFDGYCRFKIKFQDPLEKNQIDSLSLQKIRSTEIFENPLLMEMILKEIDYPDVQCLRKVSHGIRLCIDDLKPDPRIRGYSIKRKIFDKPKGEPSNITDTFDICIEFKKEHKKCIRYRSREILQGENDWDVDSYIYCGDQLIERIVNDFKFNIQNQKSTIDQLDLDLDGIILELIGNVLKSRDSPLKVYCLAMTVTNENEIMSILPYLDSVGSIVISHKTEGNLEINEIPKLIQWKNADILYIYCTIMNSIRELDIFHFYKIDIKINSLSLDDLIYLKENLIKSVNFDQFAIQIENSSFDDDNLYCTLPPYNYDADQNYTWYFPMSTTEKYLEIEVKYGYKLYFRCVSLKDVPEAYFNTLD